MDQSRPSKGEHLSKREHRSGDQSSISGRPESLRCTGVKAAIISIDDGYLSGGHHACIAAFDGPPPIAVGRLKIEEEIKTAATQKLAGFGIPSTPRRYSARCDCIPMMASPIQRSTWWRSTSNLSLDKLSSKSCVLARSF